MKSNQIDRLAPRKPRPLGRGQFVLPARQACEADGSDKKIVHALSAQLIWTHFREIIYLDNSLQRDFYAEICHIERWNTRPLKSKIQGILYERTAISKKPEELAKKELAENSNGSLLLN